MKRISVLLLVAVLTLFIVPSAAMAQFGPGSPHSTDVGISASATVVVPGTVVDLVITEANDGQLALSNPSVDLAVDLAPWLTLTKDPPYFVGGDTNDDGILDPGETWQWAVSDTVNEDKTYTVIGHGFPPPPLDIIDTTYPLDLDELDSVRVDVVHPGIDITKTVDQEVSKAGDEVIYTITITNTSDDIGLEGITVSDSLLGDLSAWFADTLAPLASESQAFPYTIQEGDPDPLVNTVTVSANPLGPLTNLISDSAQASVDLVHPSIAITKVASPTSGSVGTVITYTITITNTSDDIGLEGITVSDSLLGDLSASFADTLAALASESQDFTRAILATDPDPLVNTVVVNANPLGPLTNLITDSASASVDIVAEEGQEGLTPGFWKNHPGAWVGYATDQTLESVFDVPDSLGLDDITLMNALSFKGGRGVNGGAQILLRAAVAALLNAASPDVDYPLSTAQVISQVNAALASLDRDTMLDLAAQLDDFNNLGVS